MQEPNDLPTPDPFPTRSEGSKRGAKANTRKSKGVRKKLVFLEVKTWFPLSRKLKRVLWTLLTVTLIFAGLTYWKRAAIRKFGNEWNAERHLEKAKQALDEGTPRVAVNRAITSLQLEPNQIDALRVLFAASQKAADSRLLVVGMSLFQHPQATVEDRINGLSALNDVGDLLRFETFFNLLPEDTRALPPARYEWLRHLLIKGEARQVDALLESERGKDSDIRFALLHLDTLSAIGEHESDKKWNRVAAELLEQPLSETQGDAIWRRIAERDPGRFSPEEAAEFSKRLERSPAGPSVPATLPYSLRLAANPVRRSLHLHDAVAALRENHLDDLCRWLMMLGEEEVILEFVDEILAYRSNMAYQARVRALIDSGRLEDAFAILQFPPQVVDKMGMLILKASVARKLGRKSDEVSAWQEAILEAERDMTENRYLTLSRFAQKAGENAVAAEALVAACRHPRGIMPPSSEIQWLTTYLITNDRPIELLTVTRRLLRAEIDNPDLINNAIYLSLILDDERFTLAEESVRMTEALHQANPGKDGIRTTLALVYLAAGQEAEALALFRIDEREGMSWQHLGDADRAILAMALLANGLEAEADKFVRVVRWDRLLEAERKFFRNKLRVLLGEEPVPVDTESAETEETGGKP